eukprot:TRINITY_DN24113_c0_g1_i1.p1 TRINITY_DN24113_c0_g1~~TRINITY_DN24113_c0_g1_i1.p1  ORF type:complete len:148 (+),score=35.80 TRINITY_DN24113_c0_g1_i1:58-501(+)
MFGKCPRIVFFFFFFAFVHTVGVAGYRKREETEAAIELATEAFAEMEAEKKADSTKANLTQKSKSTKTNLTQKSNSTRATLTPEAKEPLEFHRAEVNFDQEVTEQKRREEQIEREEEQRRKKSDAAVQTTSVVVLSVGLSSIVLNMW